jgi:hypothetical protein
MDSIDKTREEQKKLLEHRSKLQQELQKTHERLIYLAGVIDTLEELKKDVKEN